MATSRTCHALQVPRARNVDDVSPADRDIGARW
jgi:hypothetical protein